MAMSTQHSQATLGKYRVVKKSVIDKNASFQLEEIARKNKTMPLIKVTEGYNLKGHLTNVNRGYNVEKKQETHSISERLVPNWHLSTSVKPLNCLLQYSAPIL